MNISNTKSCPSRKQLKSNLMVPETKQASTMLQIDAAPVEAPETKGALRKLQLKSTGHGAAIMSGDDPKKVTPETAVQSSFQIPKLKSAHLSERNLKLTSHSAVLEQGGDVEKVAVSAARRVASARTEDDDKDNVTSEGSQEKIHQSAETILSECNEKKVSSGIDTVSFGAPKLKSTPFSAAVKQGGDVGNVTLESDSTTAKTLSGEEVVPEARQNSLVKPQLKSTDHGNPKSVKSESNVQSSFEIPKLKQANVEASAKAKKQKPSANHSVQADKLPQLKATTKGAAIKGGGDIANPIVTRNLSTNKLEIEPNLKPTGHSAAIKQGGDVGVSTTKRATWAAPKLKSTIASAPLNDGEVDGIITATSKSKPHQSDEAVKKLCDAKKVSSGSDSLLFQVPKLKSMQFGDTVKRCGDVVKVPLTSDSATEKPLSQLHAAGQESVVSEARQDSLVKPHLKSTNHGAAIMDGGDPKSLLSEPNSQSSFEIPKLKRANLDAGAKTGNGKPSTSSSVHFDELPQLKATNQGAAIKDGNDIANPIITRSLSINKLESEPNLKPTGHGVALKQGGDVEKAVPAPRRATWAASKLKSTVTSILLDHDKEDGITTAASQSDKAVKKDCDEKKFSSGSAAVKQGCDVENVPVEVDSAKPTSEDFLLKSQLKPTDHGAAIMDGGDPKSRTSGPSVQSSFEIPKLKQTNLEVAKAGNGMTSTSYNLQFDKSPQLVATSQGAAIKEGADIGNPIFTRGLNVSKVAIEPSLKPTRNGAGVKQGSGVEKVAVSATRRATWAAPKLKSTVANLVDDDDGFDASIQKENNATEVPSGSDSVLFEVPKLKSTQYSAGGDDGKVHCISTTVKPLSPREKESAAVITDGGDPKSPTSGSLVQSSFGIPKLKSANLQATAGVGDGMPASDNNMQCDKLPQLKATNKGAAIKEGVDIGNPIITRSPNMSKLEIEPNLKPTSHGAAVKQGGDVGKPAVSTKKRATWAAPKLKSIVASVILDDKEDGVATATSQSKLYQSDEAVRKERDPKCDRASSEVHKLKSMQFSSALKESGNVAKVPLASDGITVKPLSQLNSIEQVLADSVVKPQLKSTNHGAAIMDGGDPKPLTSLNVQSSFEIPKLKSANREGAFKPGDGMPNNNVQLDKLPKLKATNHGAAIKEGVDVTNPISTRSVSSNVLDIEPNSKPTSYGAAVEQGWDVEKVAVSSKRRATWAAPKLGSGAAGALLDDDKEDGIATEESQSKLNQSDETMKKECNGKDVGSGSDCVSFELPKLKSTQFSFTVKQGGDVEKVSFASDNEELSSSFKMPELKSTQFSNAVKQGGDVEKSSVPETKQTAWSAPKLKSTASGSNVKESEDIPFSQDSNKTSIAVPGGDIEQASNGPTSNGPTRRGTWAAPKLRSVDVSKRTADESDCGTAKQLETKEGCVDKVSFGSDNEELNSSFKMPQLKSTQFSNAVKQGGDVEKSTVPETKQTAWSAPKLKSTVSGIKAKESEDIPVPQDSNKPSRETPGGDIEQASTGPTRRATWAGPKLRSIDVGKPARSTDESDCGTAKQLETKEGSETTENSKKVNPWASVNLNSTGQGDQVMKGGDPTKAKNN